MIRLRYLEHRAPYPWSWEAHFPDGQIYRGVGIPNYFEYPREAFDKGMDCLKKQWNKHRQKQS